MRKVLLIAMLALSTLAWAHGAKKGDQARAGNDWYQAQLNSQVNSFVAVNQAVAPSPTSEPASFQAPGSMAAPGGGSDDWYNQKIKSASDVNRRDLSALKTH